MSFVLDASTTLSMLFRDERDASTMRVLDALRGGVTAHVPTLWRFEVANGLVSGERRGRLSQAQADEFLELLMAFPVEQHETSAASALIGASRIHGLTAYDASYLLLAQRLELPLATHDSALRQSAEAGEVALF